MNKAELVSMVAEKAAHSKKDVDVVVDSLITVIKETLAGGEKIVLSGFGTFEVRERAAREGRNPRTGEKIAIPAQNSPAFSAGKALKEAVKKK